MPTEPNTQHRLLARDVRTGRVGEVMADPAAPTYVYYLRPVGGGREWEVPRESVELLDAAQDLRP